MQLYVLQFRRRMDFDTATIGCTRESLVNQKFLIDTLERHAVPGSHHAPKKRNRDFIQREIKVMVNAGLLERIPRRKPSDPMKFRLPMADKNKGKNKKNDDFKVFASIRSEEERTRSALGGVHYQKQCDQPTENPESTRHTLVRSSAEYNEGSNDDSTSRSAPIQGNGDKTKYITNARENDLGFDYTENDMTSCDEFSDVEGFARPIPKDWLPSDSTMQELAPQLSECNDISINWHITRFRFHWLDCGKPQRDWEKVFIWFTRKYGVSGF